MENNRLIPFLIVAVMVMVGFSLLQRAVLPPREIPKDKEIAKGKKGKEGDKGEAVKGKKKDAKIGGGDKQKADKKDKKKGGKKPSRQPQTDPKKASPKTPKKPVVPSAWYSIGSLDGSSKYPFLVVFSNRGGTIHSAYFNSRKYRDLESRSGFLGPLVLTESSSGKGCTINLVPPGSAAAQAGLKIGDVVIKIGEELITSVAQYDDWIVTTKPGDEVKLQVLRDGKPVNVTATLLPRPLALISPQLLPRGPGSCALSIHRIGPADDATAVKPEDYAINGLEGTLNDNWTATVNQNGVEFRYQITDADLTKAGQSGGLELWKKFEFVANDGGDDITKEYTLDVKVGVRNTAKTKQTVSYLLYGPANLPTEGWWYTVKIHPSQFSTIGARDIILKAHTAKRLVIGGPKIFNDAKSASGKGTDPTTKPIKGSSALDYIGVDTQYFTAILIPDVSVMYDSVSCFTLSDIDTLEGKHVRLANSSFRLGNTPMTLDPNGSYEHKYKLYLGPKDPQVLKRYELGETVVYGWFAIFARPLSGLLHFLVVICLGNYGIAIILLTVIVRGCMFPLSRKAAQSAQMMQVLAPEMKKINEKHKNDMQKRGEELRKLWAKHNYNPYGSCLLMFVQLPVFIGLFRALSVDIKLRGAALLPGITWCSNLAGPDQFWYWENIVPAMLSAKTGWLGPYFNILPICTIVLFFIHQKLFTPPPTDDQQKMAQTMMKFMMFFVAMLFFKVPSGLCLYFIASSIWGLCERIFLPKPPTPEGTTETAEKTGEVSASTTHARNKAKKKRRRR